MSKLPWFSFPEGYGFHQGLWLYNSALDGKVMYFANANLEALAFGINESFCSIVGILLLLLFGVVWLEVFFSYCPQEF